MDRLWTPWRYAYVTGADRSRRQPGVPEALAAWPGDLHCVFCNIIAAADYAIAHGISRDQAEQAAGILERGTSCFMVLYDRQRRTSRRCHPYLGVTRTSTHRGLAFLLFCERI